MGVLRNLAQTFLAAFTVGLGTSKTTLTSSAATLDVDAPVIPRGFASRVKSITVADSPYTPGNELLILVDASGGNVTINLGTLASTTDRVWQFCKTDTSANTVTLAPNGAEKINTTLSTYVVAVPNNVVELQSASATSWQITGTASRTSFLVGATDTYGDASDGDVTVAGTTTLARNTYYDNLVVTGTLNTAAFLPYVHGRLSGNGTIACVGPNGSGGTGGTGFSATTGYLGGSGNGGTSGVTGGSGGGRTSSRAAAGTGVNPGDGGQGGASGGGGPGGGAAGNAVTIAAATGSDGDVLIYRAGAWGNSFSKAHGAAGGGAGGVNVNSTAGGGGAGGGPLLLRARIMDFSGTVTAAGGNGDNAAIGTGIGAGGGAGGGGGWVTVVSDEFRQIPTVSTAGGTPGNGVGTGSIGNAGNSGPVDGAGYTTFIRRIAA